MGSVYVREFLGISEPRIGLINVGGEAFVGDRTVVEAHRLLTESGFNYVGFVEGRDIPTGAADVLVTNGFVGNVLLKFAEGVPKLVASLAGGLSDEAKAIIARGLDYNAYGGEPLLGVKGVSIICHGASKDRAIAQGIFQAARIAKMDIHHRIEEFLVDKFASYFSQVKYLGSFRRSLKSSESTESETN